MKYIKCGTIITIRTHWNGGLVSATAGSDKELAALLKISEKKTLRINVIYLTLLYYSLTPLSIGIQPMEMVNERNIH
ncbi:hypothetical protein PHET_00841 [Paragonimus heterotremus]|uniref:Uncharacterized protein n=1 Tax=Paragonimus heterotremus TaxID=100268 RepID=A0A8J4TNI2_9TREM|nr:hypothetical protein PHET_00841 [Paragonimus heterotremus]